MANVVVLPEIKLTDFKPADIYSTNANSNDPAKILEPRPNLSAASSEPNLLKSSSPETRRPPDKRLAEDKLGTELTPGATIWELYQEEANEFDNELVDGRNKNLDTMLLFAGLFSAVVTGFVVESKRTLQQDPAEASLFLLLQIARSQQRSEEGITAPTSPTITIPEFNIPTSARWINGLWFMSLGLSLCAAFVAMLAKEWLVAFVASRPRSPYARARVHQKRIRGITWWHALHIIDLLPTLMYLALVLFSVGLVIDLWGLDSAIALAMLVVIGVTILFYVLTLIFASISESCPFATQISKYTKALLTSHQKSSASVDYVPSDLEPAEATSLENFQALDWLAKNAQDPVVGDCSYQALAGINPEIYPNNTPTLTRGDHILPAKHGIKTLTRVHRHATEMLRIICARIPQIMLSTRNSLSNSQEYALSRYAVALPRLVELLGTDSALRDGEKQDHSTPPAHKVPVQIALEVIDNVWNNAKSRYTADTYALLTVAELNLTRLAASHFHAGQEGSCDNNQQRPNLNDRDSHAGAENWSAVDVIPSGETKLSLFNLRARFSRALFRIAAHLGYRGEGCISMRTDALVQMLDSTTLAFLCAPLNPQALVSTHQRQRDDEDTLPFFHIQMADTGIQCFITPFEIDDIDGIITGLLRVICSTTSAEAPELMRSASRALCVVAPVLLRQWLFMQLNSGDCSHEQGLRINEAIYDSTMLWWETPSDFSDNTLGVWTLRELMEIAYVSSAFSEHRGIRNLSGRALHTLCHLAKQGSGRDCGTQVVEIFGSLVTKLIQVTSATQNLSSLKYLMQWLLSMDLLGRSTLVQRARSSDNYDLTIEIDHYQVFFNIWARNQGLDSEMKHLVGKISEGIMDDAIEFLWGAQGLVILTEIGNRLDYAPVLVELLECMIQHSLNTRETHYWEDPPILPFFLSLLDRVSDHTPDLGVQYPIIPRTILLVAETVLTWVKQSNELAELCEDAAVAALHKLLTMKGIETLPEHSQILMAYGSIVKRTES